MDKAVQIINLLNAAVPGIATMIQIIKNQDGTVSLTIALERADQQFDANLQQVADWFKALELHGRGSCCASVAQPPGTRS